MAKKSGRRLFVMKSRATWRSFELKKMAASPERIRFATTDNNWNCALCEYLLSIPLHWSMPTHGSLSVTSSFSNFSTESTANTSMQIVRAAFNSSNAFLRWSWQGKNAGVPWLYFAVLFRFVKSKCTSTSSLPWQTSWNSFQLIKVPWPRERSVWLSADTS